MSIWKPGTGTIEPTNIDTNPSPVNPQWEPGVANGKLLKGDKGDAGPTGATGVQGPAGATGPEGPAGPSGSAAASFEYTQSSPATTWYIAHNLGFHPNFMVQDTDMPPRTIWGFDVFHTDLNNSQLVFGTPEAGVATAS